MTDDFFDPWAALASAESTLANSSRQTETAAREKPSVPPITYDNLSNSSHSSHSSHSSRGAPKLSPNSQENPKERKKNSIAIYQSLSPGQGGRKDLGTGGAALDQEGTPAIVANLLEFGTSSSDRTEKAEIGVARVNRPSSRPSMSSRHVPGPSDQDPICINDVAFYPRQHDPSRCSVCGDPEDAERALLPILTPRPGEHHWLHASCRVEHSRRIESAWREANHSPDTPSNSSEA